ncbi:MULTISPECIES: AEC family transporter [Cohaesibacter]|uniref:AEC family transporter n=1 Tax=Cohaesibacter TaxID=655352 RepID=UPI000DE85090|nr:MULTISPECIES: AEC family transporter [Cohaesibacter]TLP49119.1 AEC family transporter [Cohaesibacter sp. CAU 1516]
MSDLFTLALPFFGLIFLGFLSGKITRLPEGGLAWLNFFVVYIALPALFFRLVSQTPLEELTNWSFVVATTVTTYIVFTLAFVFGLWKTKGNMAEATIQGLAGSYSNIGYMGPGLTLAALGPAATVPTALIFCFDSLLLFTLIPIFMALSGTDEKSGRELTLYVVKKVFLHPFIIATILGVLAAAIHFEPPGWIAEMLRILSGAAAPCALFAMGVAVALRQVRRIPGELSVLLPIKLVLHPVLLFLLLGFLGTVPEVWIKTAILMACLPPAANVFIVAQQYDVYVERASSTVMIGTLVSVVTVTFFLYLITQNVLPF